MSCQIGAFVNGLENLSNFQKHINHKLAVVLFYVHWNDAFPQEQLQIIDANSSIGLLTWEPWLAKGLDPILNGEQDEYIRVFMQKAKEFGKPILLRFGHEMNGNWYPWDGVHNGNEAGPNKYIKAWRYIYNVREKLSAHNVLLVWCPNNVNVPDQPWNQIKNYFPGDEYVDWIGMDGYNWGYQCQESFDQVFKKIYEQLCAISKKDIMIGEFACGGEEDLKLAWIVEALDKIKTQYPRVKLFCWFNINKERDWLLGPRALETFADKIADGYFDQAVI